MSARSFMQRRHFHLIPWQQDFLTGLLDLALAESAATGQPLSEVLFIFPHARPARYLERLISLDKRLAKPCLLPEMLPVHQLFEKLRGECLPPALDIGRLDQIGLLLECVRAEQAESEPQADGFEELPTGDARLFFPWGGRLANLFEDCFIHGVQPGNFLYLEEELNEYAALLLGRLGNLHRRYLEALTARNWTTSGLTAWRVAERLRQEQPGGLGALFPPGRPIYLAGFYSLNGCEDILFRQLWEKHEARVVAHADAALAASGENAHWSCAGLEKWRANWGARWELAPEAEKAPPRHQVIKYYSGYDLHSQLKALQAAQADGEAAKASSAVILPDTELLLPVLHQVRNKDLNISMGYPLDKSALNQLLENILKLQENKRPGGYYWKDCIRLIRHPYIKMLAPGLEQEGLEAEGLMWRGFLHGLEKKLREANRRYLDFNALLRQVFLSRESEAAESAALLPLLEEFAAVCLEGWQNLDNIGALAAALERLCAWLAARGESLWPRFPIDAECLYRFRQQVGPELRFSALRDEKLPPETLFAILRALVREERVPFEAYPLTAAQIMGLLESRLLSFERVFILGASDELLPGGAQNDPLLPDGLRREIGLPDIFRKQRMSAYYFFRLLAGAEEAHIFWEEGAEGGLFDSKKLRSRFVEELLWQEEQRRGRLLEATNESDSPLRQLGSETQAPASLGRSLPPQVRELGRETLEHKFSLGGKNITAGKMNAFLTCPLAFYYRELAALQPLRDIADGEDPAETGDFLHEVFYGHYSLKLGSELEKSVQALGQSQAELNGAFRQKLASSRISESFPQDALAGLRALAPLRLERYLNEQPQRTRVVALEASARAELLGPDGRRFTLLGRLDRIDERHYSGRETVLTQHGELADEAADEPAPQKTAAQSGLVILDYKSGKIAPPVPGFWENSALWRDIFQALREPEQEHGELLAVLAEQLNGNAQLPFYLHLLRHGQLDPDAGQVLPELLSTRRVRNAAWVDLGGDGKERLLLPEELPEAELEDILDRKIPALLHFLLNEMSVAAFTAREGKHCAYCAYAPLCRVAG